jgi:3',5'-cyclic-AMP phosphodiesterase
MSLSRRRFLRIGLNGAFVITAGNVLRPLDENFFNDVSRGNQLCRFAIASDGHFGQPDTEFETQHDEMVQWINSEKTNQGLDFTVINGDLFHDDVSFLEPVKKRWDNLAMPYYVSHGNHDKVGEYQWTTAWNVPWHFSFEHGDIGIIVLNTADEKGNYICPDVDWTKRELEKLSSKKQLFIFMHITPFTWTKGGIACPAIVDLFGRQKNLKAVFHGHDHDEDDVKANNGRFYFFDSHVAGSWGTRYNGYRIVEVFENGQIVTYQMNPKPMKKVNNTQIE